MPRLRGILKSATISFGENLVPDDWTVGARRGPGRGVPRVGTSLGVYPAAGLPETALGRGARLVMMNAEATPFDDLADAVLSKPIGEVLPALCEPVAAIDVDSLAKPK